MKLHIMVSCHGNTSRITGPLCEYYNLIQFNSLFGHLGPKHILFTTNNAIIIACTQHQFALHSQGHGNKAWPFVPHLVRWDRRQWNLGNCTYLSGSNVNGPSTLMRHICMPVSVNVVDKVSMLSYHFEFTMCTIALIMGIPIPYDW